MRVSNLTVGHRRWVTAVTRLPRWRRRKTRLQMMLSRWAVVVSLAFLAVGLLWWWSTSVGTRGPHKPRVGTRGPHKPRVGTRGPHKPSVVDLDFNGVKVRKFIPPEGPSSEAGIIYIHGGGWQFGSVDAYARLARGISVETGMTVISVEYRLAPNHVFPAAIDDCETAARHFLSVANKFGVDPHRVAVMGDSAGGNLAAALSLRLRDKKVSPSLKAIVLINPATQALDFRLPSYLRHKNPKGLNAHKMARFWMDYGTGNHRHIQHLLNGTHVSPDTRRRFAKYVNNGTVVTISSVDTPYETLWQQLEPIITNPYFSPGLADDLSCLPRTLILTAGQDPLHDDGEIYAKRLKESGNDVTHRDYPSARHGDYWSLREMRKVNKDFLVRNL